MAMNAEQKGVGSDILEWFGILAGPLVWLTQFLTNYALVRWECINHGSLALHVVSAVALAIVISSGIVALVYFLKTREYSAASEQLPARPHFMAALGILSASLYSFAIIAQAIPSFILDPCQR
jgi:hypothetical protein